MPIPKPENNEDKQKFVARCMSSETMKKEYPNFNADMWIGQYVFRHLLVDKKLLIGYPFTSDFKQYQNDRKDVYFIHK